MRTQLFKFQYRWVATIFIDVMIEKYRIDVDADFLTISSPLNQSGLYCHSEMWSLWICALLCVRLAFGADGRTETTPTNATDDGNSVLELVILHNNDMHSRFEQTDETYNVCSDEDAAKNRCYGGFARVRHV